MSTAKGAAAARTMASAQVVERTTLPGQLRNQHRRGARQPARRRRAGPLADRCRTARRSPFAAAPAPPGPCRGAVGPRLGLAARGRTGAGAPATPAGPAAAATASAPPARAAPPLSRQAADASRSPASQSTRNRAVSRIASACGSLVSPSATARRGQPAAGVEDLAARPAAHEPRSPRPTRARWGRRAAPRPAGALRHSRRRRATTPRARGSFRPMRDGGATTARPRSAARAPPRRRGRPRR